MGNKLFEMTYNGTFTFSPEEKLVRELKKAHAWFLNSTLGKVFTGGFAVIDFLGFWQLAKYSMTDDSTSRAVIVLAFLVAFELAPLYFGYALGLKCYNLGKPIHKYVKIYSFMAFVLGVIANFSYRVFTYNVMAEYYEESALAITIVMIILPVITSLMSVVLGCLTFDPLLFEMNTVSKKLNRLNIAKRRLKAALVEYGDLSSGNDNVLIENEDKLYEHRLKILEACRQELYTYVDWKIDFYKIKK